MNLSIMITAIRHGAMCGNHIKVTGLIKNDDGKLCGASVIDQITGKQWNIRAKCIINATGPFTDVIRKMADPGTESICQPSAGVHIVLPGYYRYHSSVVFNRYETILVQLIVDC